MSSKYCIKLTEHNRTMLFQENIPVLRKHTVEHLEAKCHDFVTYPFKAQKVCVYVQAYIHVHTHWKAILVH